MTLARRAVLQSALVAGGAISIPALAAPPRHNTVIHVGDSALLSGRAALSRARPGDAMIDMAQARRNPHQALAQVARGRAILRGVTRWDDWVVMRAILLDKRLRVCRLAVEQHAGRAIVRWEMA